MITDFFFFFIFVAAGNNPGFENDYGDTWGYFREKLENDAAIGIVGAVFLLTIILVAIGIIFCYRRYLVGSSA